ncbi:KTSC domain-containing protein [Mucilaginibacter sp. KACC 22063]|uniref:KTSC domain-containing protein n=1 Tax=Mucilaginibacter sp. KACC 22063 TaxID=3025666 RepID=UPI0023671ACF|nr:KTSC domain-containing protein [Mucilaginibacter sp. KACC 22063]WDF55459.1 KTSC domain-containing protein [Mucilaginibacter sp. KACC 22063]
MPSAVVSSYDYDSSSQDLKVTYTSGVVYTYKSVPEKVYKELKASQSKGRYLNFFIKGKYEYEKTLPGDQ